MIRPPKAIRGRWLPSYLRRKERDKTPDPFASKSIINVPLKRLTQEGRTLLLDNKPWATGCSIAIATKIYKQFVDEFGEVE